jgi:NAD(P)-dependent dehydrogenase (short-subunit alcohol dehydrogenase family)
MIKFDKEQRIIVTGASSGIGEGTALMLNELGASVIGIGRNTERLQAMRAKCKYPENCFVETKDLAEDIEGLPAYVKSLKEKYGKFHGLALCAGINEVKPLQLLSFDEMSHLFNINYFSSVFMAKGFADRRINNGSGSAIVAVSSGASSICEKGHISYSGSKAALCASMKAMATELVKFGIRVNVLSPTEIKTPMTMDGLDREKLYPLGFGEVDDVAAFIAYLLSDKAKWIACQDYIIDCGYMLI